MTNLIDWKPAKRIREHRAGTKRAKVIAMLSRKNGAARAGFVPMLAPVEGDPQEPHS